MKLILLSLILSCSPFISVAQQKHGCNLMYPCFSIQKYFDVNAVRYDAGLPQGHIHPKNTMGSYFGLQYERTTRYGMILGGGIAYGTRRYDISIYQDVSNFDPVAINNLQGRFYSNDIKLDVNYWSYVLMAGYKKKVYRGISIVAKGGVGLKNFYDGSWINSEYFLTYIDDNTGAKYKAELIDIETRFGRNKEFVKKGFIGRNRFPKSLHSFEAYIGIEKEISKSVIKNVTIGVEGSRNWWSHLNDGELTIGTSESISKLISGRANFYDRNLCIGLRISVGLWK